MKQKTSIVILTYNNLDETKECLKSIQKYTKKDTYEIIIVDNLSTDGTREFLKKQKKMKVIFNEENLGFPKGCNQGIQLAKKDHDILLLNNDTIVTTNWLTNLKKCLYSDSKIGAVGAVSNHNENLQGCNFEYSNFSDMQKLAKENNQSDPSRWEEKVFLIGFCLLIKREVIDQIHSLDEKYTPGYIEDNDLSLRIIKAGYRLMLCHDCFIHHYLGSSFRKDLNTFYPILQKNRDYFMQKWNFHTECFDVIKDASIRLMENSNHILELNCGIGISILKMKYQFTNMEIHGVETDENKRNISNSFTKVFSSIDEVDEKYDTILIGDLLEHVENPLQLINQIKNYLKDDGYLIGEIHNVASIEHILPLLKEEWYWNHKNRKNHFTIHDIEKLFYQEEYKNGYVFSWISNLNDEQQKVVQILKQISEKNYDIVHYSFRFQK